MDRASTEVVIRDGKDEVSYIEAPFMNDATGKNYSEDIGVELEKIEDGVYGYTMTLSEDYLEDAEYPVTVDPSHTWKGSSDLIDVYVVSGSTYGNTNFYSSDTKIMPAGIASDGHTYRTYMKLIDLKSTIGESYVESATLTLYERSGSAKNQTVNINRVLENWTASTVTWNSKPSYSSAVSGTFRSSGTANTAHAVNLTSLVRGFVNGTYAHNYGISIRNATSSPSYVSFYGSRSTSSSYRPKLAVTYYDKPSRADRVYFEKLRSGEYRETLYYSQGSNVYANWEGITSRGLSDIEYKVTAYDSSTPSPTHVTGSSSSADLTSYRSLGVSSSSGSHVRLPYMQYLPEGKYRVYIRGTDAGGMHGPGKYKVLRIDGTAPDLTASLPETSEEEPSADDAPVLTWEVTEENLSAVTISVNGSEPERLISSPHMLDGSLLIQGDNEIVITASDKAGNTDTKTLHYHLDSMGNVSGIRTGGQKVSDISYDALGRMTERRDCETPGGTSYILREYAYDGAGRTSSMDYSFSGGLIRGYSYEYSGSRITEKTVTDSEGNETAKAYEYDSLGRLTSAGRGSEMTQYTYDAAGNRLTETAGENTASYSYNGLSQLTEMTDADGSSTGYSYDSRGNLVRTETETAEGSEAVRTYSYSVTGELLAVSENGTEIQRNIYDENGIRIRSGDRDYCYAGGMLISSGDAEYITDPYGNVVSACHDGDYYVYSSDIQGSTECITEGENIAAEYEYSDFGEMTSSADEDFFNDICYAGAVYDEATGMYYMGARYYEPDTGRFITQDTYRGKVSDSNTWHLYAYCSNDPVNYTDPSGHLRMERPKRIPKTVWKKIKMYVSKIPSRRVHYGRNSKNTKLPKNKNMADAEGWEKLSYALSICHQFGRNYFNCNLKYVSPSGQHREVVYTHKGDIIVTDARNLGTYNFSGPDDILGHYLMDVIPWIAWGNSYEDSTELNQRFDKFAYHIPTALRILRKKNYLGELVRAISKY